MTEEEFTPDEFDAAFAAATPVEVVGRPRVVLEHDFIIPGATSTTRTDAAGYASGVGIRTIGKPYVPLAPGATTAQRPRTAVAAR